MIFTPIANSLDAAGKHQMENLLSWISPTQVFADTVIVIVWALRGDKESDLANSP
jgi:hypothetical protein